MDKETIYFFIGLLIGSLFSFLFTGFLFTGLKNKEWKKQLIEQNLAVYEVNQNTGDVTFKLYTEEEIKNK